MIRKMSERASWYRGFLASFSIALGYIPAGITFGMLAQLSGWGRLETILTSGCVFAGASQFAMISLGSSLFPGMVIPLFLNLRHVVYSLFVASRFRLQKPHIVAFGLTDEVFALAQKTKDERFLWGLETGAYFFWVLGTTVGVFGGDFLASYHLFVSSLLFSLTPLFLVLLLPTLRGSRIWSAILGGAIALFCHTLGYTSLGILLAGVLSPLLVMEGKRRKGRERPE